MKQKNYLVIYIFLIAFVGCGDVSRESFLAGKFGDVDFKPPEILSPLNNARITGVHENDTKLVWSPRIGALRYHVEIVYDDGSANPFALAANDIVHGNPFSIAAPKTSLKVTLPDAFSYIWRVRSDVTKSDDYTIGRFDSFADAVYLYCPAEAECNEDTTGDGITDTTGTKTNPYRTFAEAIAQSVSLSLELHVANRDSTGAAYQTTVNMISGSRLVGGFDASDWQQTLKRTKLQSEATRVVSISGVADNETSFDFFSVSNIGTVRDSSALYVAGSDSSLSIRNSEFWATPYMDTHNEFVSAIELVSSSPVIENNIILGPGSRAEAAGTNVEASAILLKGLSHPLMTGNLISLGTGVSPFRGAVWAEDALASKAIGNIIFGRLRNFDQHNIAQANVLYDAEDHQAYYFNLIQAPGVISGGDVPDTVLGNIYINTEGGTWSPDGDDLVWNSLHDTVLGSEDYKNYPVGHYVTAISTGSNLTYDGNENTIELMSADCLAFNTGDHFEYLLDGVARQVTANNCALNNTIEFEPALEELSRSGAPILHWGTRNSDYDKRYIPNSALHLDRFDCTNLQIEPVTYTVTSDEVCPGTQTSILGGLPLYNCTVTALQPAQEILLDGIGNDNGHCETGESCIFTPNHGPYQGHGQLIAGDCTPDSLLPDVQLYKYEVNGYE